MVNIPAWHWYALRTPVHREFKAMEALQARGFVVATAYEMRTRRKHRRSKGSYRYPIAVISRYIFVGFPAGIPPWRLLFEDPELAPLVDGVVSVTSNGMPTRMPPSSIENLNNIFGDSIFVVPHKTEVADPVDVQVFQVGDTVRIGQWVDRHGEEEFDVGGFAGHVVTIQEIRGPIAKTVMSWFGGEHEVLVPLERLAAA